MIPDKDFELPFDRFGQDYYFTIKTNEEDHRQKQLVIKKTSWKSCLFSWRSSNQEKCLKKLAKTYFHCIKHRPSFNDLPVSSSATAASSSSTSSSSTAESSSTPVSLAHVKINHEDYRHLDLIARLFNQYFQINQISFGTWNIGGPPDFFHSLPLYHKDALPLEWQEEDLSSSQKIEENLQQWESRRIEQIKVKIEAAVVDVLCLQEIHEHDIGQLRDWFNSKGYEIIADGRDAAVLFKKDLFEQRTLPTISTRGRTSVKAELVFKESQQVIAIGSAHITGFNLGDPEAQFGSPTEREYDQGDEELSTFTKELIIDQDKVTAVLLGIDANSNENVHPERITIPLLAGFKRNQHNDGKTTAFNRSFGEAQLDHLYWLKGRCTKLYFEPHPLPEHISPPSDHKIVSGTVTIINRKLGSF